MSGPGRRPVVTPELMNDAAALVAEWQRDLDVTLTPVQQSTLRAMIAAALADTLERTDA